MNEGSEREVKALGILTLVSLRWGLFIHGAYNDGG